jgi:hypothetical protein
MSKKYYGSKKFINIARGLPQKRASDVDEIVEVINFLYFKDRGSLSGQVINCNGGIYI